jgi:hypothetical protein
MMRSVILFLFLLFTGAARAQQPVTPPPDSTVLLVQPAIFYLQTGQPFFSWVHRPDTFEFILFDRWGEPVARSVKPDFKIDDAMLDNKPPLRISDTYIYVIRVTFKGKPRKEYSGSLVYEGKYCSG